MSDSFLDYMDQYGLKREDLFKSQPIETPSLVQEPEEDDEPTLSGGKLKKDDLLEYENLNKIRTYMMQRKGVDYKDKDAEEVVDDFIDHMRWFNSNLVSTGGEVRYISKADENQKRIAKDAYQLYDDLGNVFVNDGFFGAVDGVKDYILAAAADPTNYLGLFTGGIGKAMSLWCICSLAGSLLIRL